MTPSPDMTSLPPARAAMTWRAKTGKGKGVGKKDGPAAAAHARQREMPGQRGGRLVFPQDAQRQQPARGGAGRLDLDFAEQNFVRVIADLDDIRNPRVLDRLILET